MVYHRSRFDHKHVTSKHLSQATAAQLRKQKSSGKYKCLTRKLPDKPKPNSRPLASLPCHSLKTSCAVDRRGPAVMNSRTLAINQSLHQSANQSVQQSTYLPMYLHIYLPNYLIYLSIYLSAYPLHLAIYLHN